MTGDTTHTQIDLSVPGASADRGGSASNNTNNFGGVFLYAVTVLAIIGMIVSAVVSTHAIDEVNTVRQVDAAENADLQHQVDDAKAEAARSTTAAWLVRNDVTTLRDELASKRVPVSTLFRRLPDRAPQAAVHQKVK